MFTRYYDPEIFVQTLDGLDRANHIVATYFMDDELPGEDFVDHFALIQSMALEGSTGTWERVEGRPEPWEARALFAPDELERQVRFLKENPPRGKRVAQAEAELRAIWRDRRLTVGSRTPSIIGRDAAQAAAIAYGLPGWD